MLFCGISLDYYALNIEAHHSLDAIIEEAT